MFLEMLTVGPLQTNAYVVACEETHHAVVIDPGAEAERIHQALKAHDFTPQAILATHGHPDHVGAVATLSEKTGAPFFIHQADLPLIQERSFDPIRLLIGGKPPPTPAKFLNDGETLTVGTLTLTIIHTPGHTPGGVCFLTGQHLFSGDTLFAHSIGRTDLPGGNYHQLIASIGKKLLPLNDAVNVYAGHGERTSIGHERQSNPFLLQTRTPV